MTLGEAIRFAGRIMAGLTLADGLSRRQLRSYHAVGLALWIIGELATQE